MPTSKFEIGAVVTIVLGLIGGALWLGNMQGTLNSLSSESIQKERDKAIASINAAKSKIPSSIEDITKILPVGSIIPSMLPPERFYSLASGKWQLADGSKISNTTGYAEHVGSLKLPDLRNMFIRGASKNRALGSFEDDATRLPTSNFTGVTTSNGAHTHPKGSNHSSDKIKAGPYANMSTATTIPSSGGHSHSLKINGGGDSETRPKNIAVNFFVKIDY